MGKPQEEHRWLEQLVGEWTGEGDCSMGPDQPPVKNQFTETVRSIQGMWVMGEGKGEMPDGSGPTTTIITLGFDPAKGKFVGTFIGSMMTNLWVYEGTLDADRRVLTLHATGPNFADMTKTASYQDIVEMIDADHRVLRSLMQGDDGQWVPIMTAHYHRKK
ncbi:hypothetical protein STHU_38810 [Allostella humosa]|nr:hypothetical protein STHU_38810 [Stella humosa]